MVSSQVLQKTIDELRAITRIDLCVLSLEGQKVASTFSEEGFEPEYVREFVKSPAGSQVLQVLYSSRLQYSLRIHRQTARLCRTHISLKYTMIRMWNMFW